MGPRGLTSNVARRRGTRCRRLRGSQTGTSARTTWSRPPLLSVIAWTGCTAEVRPDPAPPNVYTGAIRIPGADPRTWKVLNSQYSLDARTAFWGGSPFRKRRCNVRGIARRPHRTAAFVDVSEVRAYVLRARRAGGRGPIRGCLVGGAADAGQPSAMSHANSRQSARSPEEFRIDRTCNWCPGPEPSRSHRSRPTPQ